MESIQFSQGVLRELSLKDIPTIVRLSQESDIQEQYYVHDIGDLQAYWQQEYVDLLQDRHKGFVRFTHRLSIEVNAAVVGLVSLSVLPSYVFVHDSDTLLHQVDVSYFVGKEYRNQGIAYNALATTIEQLFLKYDVGEVAAITLQSNYPSQRLLRRLGLQQTWQGKKWYGIGVGQEVVYFSKKKVVNEVLA